MAKLKVTEVAKQIALEGMQMMGGYGYATEYDMERHVRTALVSTIYGGTNEIQREIISQDARAVSPASSSFGAGRKTIRLSSPIAAPPRRIAVWKPSAPSSPESSARAQLVERRGVAPRRPAPWRSRAG